MPMVAAGNGIDFANHQARPMEMDYAISNGFGFGGVNASALLRRWTDKRAGTSAESPVIESLPLPAFADPSNR
jgi:hypothetical protein